MVSPDYRSSDHRSPSWSNLTAVVAEADVAAAAADGTSAVHADPARICRRTHSFDCRAT